MPALEGRQVSRLLGPTLRAFHPLAPVLFEGLLHGELSAALAALVVVVRHGLVEYIVETVGKLVEGKTPQEVGGLTANWRPAKTRRPISVLDPACGSGSFLILAYQYLLDWYLQQYTEADEPQGRPSAIGSCVPINVVRCCI